MKFYTKIILSLLMTGLVLCLFSGISCTLTPQGIRVLTGDYTCPKLVSFDLTSENEALLCFSQEIEFENLALCENQKSTAISVEPKKIQDGHYQLDFSENLDCRKLYTLEGNVKDSHGNTLYFRDTFQGFNERVPKIRLNEIRTEYSKPKCEFIELLALSDGNLGGMELITASDGKEKNYIFPAAEVKAGEYIVVHFRKIEEGETDELGSNTNESGGSESGIWRDLWVDNTSARIAKSDVVLLKDRINGNIVDAVLFAESSCSGWKNDFIAQCAQDAFESSLWEGSASTDDTVCSDGITTSRTLSRISDGHSEKDWIVVATKGCTMGGENSKVEYVPTK